MFAAGVTHPWVLPGGRTPAPGELAGPWCAGDGLFVPEHVVVVGRGCPCSGLGLLSPRRLVSH